MTKHITPRTQLVLGDFNDNTRIKEPSVCDPDQSESIQYLLEKCIAGKVPLHYDVAPGVKTSDAIDSLSPTEQDGFDLSDAAVILTPPEKPQEAPVPPAESASPESQPVTPPPAPAPASPAPQP